MGNSASSFRGSGQGEYYPPRYDGKEVCLNIYDLSADLSLANTVVFDVLRVGGAFHAGVEVWGREWSFGVDGVQTGKPRWHDFHVYRETIRMGRTDLNPEGVVRLIGEMMEKWRGVTYDFFQRNCCSFCNEFCQRLGVGPIPDWVQRLAKAAGKTLQVLEEAAAALGLESPRQNLRRAFQDADEEENSGNSEYYEDETGQPGAPWEVPDEVLDAVAGAWVQYRQEYHVRCPPGSIPGSGLPSQQRKHRGQPRLEYYPEQPRVIDELGVTTRGIETRLESVPLRTSSSRDQDEDPLSKTFSTSRGMRSASFVCTQMPSAKDQKVVHQTKLINQACDTKVREFGSSVQDRRINSSSSFVEVQYHDIIPRRASFGGSFCEARGSGGENFGVVGGWSTARMPKGSGGVVSCGRQQNCPPGPSCSRGLGSACRSPQPKLSHWA